MVSWNKAKGIRGRVRTTNSQPLKNQLQELHLLAAQKLGDEQVEKAVHCMADSQVLSHPPVLKDAEELEF